jgi:hypothetical protein
VVGERLLVRGWLGAYGNNLNRCEQCSSPAWDNNITNAWGFSRYRQGPSKNTFRPRLASRASGTGMTHSTPHPWRHQV